MADNSFIAQIDNRVSPTGPFDMLVAQEEAWFLDANESAGCEYRVRVQEKWHKHNLTNTPKSQLKEREVLETAVDDAGPSGDTRDEAGDGNRAGGALDTPITPDALGAREIVVFFTEDQTSLYAAWNTLADLMDVTGEVSADARAKPPKYINKVNLENSVLGTLQELGRLEDDKA